MRIPKRIQEHREGRRKVTLSKRLFRVISVILLLVLVAIIFATEKGLEGLYLISAGLATWRASDAVELAYDRSPQTLMDQLDEVESDYDVGLEILLPNGGLVYATYYRGEMDNGPYTTDSIVIPEESRRKYDVIDDADNFGDSFHFELWRLGHEPSSNEYLVFIRQFSSGLTMHVYRLRSPVDTNARIAVVFIAVLTMILLSIALTLIFIFVNRTTKPLIEMSRVTQDMSKLDFTQKCEPSNVEEIDQLSQSINDMGQSLETALADLSRQNEKLQQDIEQERTIEQLRSAFINGVSHELKTPIAIISGYAEGVEAFLEAGDAEKASAYCRTIRSETDRMNNLVLKLLEIIKYESGDYQPVAENFRISDIFDDWFLRNEKILSEKKIFVENLTDPSFIGHADTFMVATVASNYLSNAVSHAEGEKRITVNTERVGNVFRVSVFNTGKPIADKDIHKIWDSFYRADKSMSRAQGRFGLGLAVVVSIQRLQNMEYGVRNEPDGVTFWFDIEASDADLPDGEVAAT